MIVYPHAKINLGLRITEKRADGFHELETLFYPIGLHDVLEIVEDKEVAKGQCHFTLSGMELEDDGNNLCVQAYQLLHKKYNLPAIKMQLHKIIPVGAGLGGGSSDAAFTIRVLNELFALQMPVQQMRDMAAILGSDCAFFVEDAPAFASGRGELLEPLNFSLKDHYILIINPGIHVSTAMAYGGVTPKASEGGLKAAFEKKPEEWGDAVTNDFETHIFKAFPAIEKLKNDLLAQGAAYAAMSGSGSTVFGIFKEKPSLDWIPQDYFVKLLMTNY